MKKIHRFLVPFRRHDQIAIIEDRDALHQMRTVLKLNVGEDISLQDGKGEEVRGRLVSISEEEIRMEIVSSIQIPPDEIRIALYAAIVKGEHFDLIAEKATELGITRLVPVIANRSIKKEIRRERVERIMREAVEQSEGGWLPEVADPLSLEEALKEIPLYLHTLFLDPEANIQFSDLVAAPDLLPPDGRRDIALFVGPEGGWEEAEIQAAMDAGCERVSFGRRILKAETAAIAGCTALRLLRA